MRELFKDFMQLKRRPNGTIRIPLGADQTAPELVGLKVGERVRLIYPGNLTAEAAVEIEEHNGWRLWYAVLPNEDAIRDIHPETLAEAAQARAATIDT
jgi:hypothetical protein